MVRVQTRMPSLSNSPRIRSAPHSRFCAAISLINVTVSSDTLGLREAALDLYFQNRRASLAMPPQERLWLNDEQRLLPGSNHFCQQHQEHPICFGVSRSFDLSTENNQLLTQKRIFCHEFGLASGKVGQRSHEKRGVGWFGPVNEAALKQLKADAYQLLHGGDNIMHGVRFPF